VVAFALIQTNTALNCLKLLGKDCANSSVVPNNCVCCWC